MMASIGNGYVATVVGSDTLYATGVFNGELTNSTDVVRARIPSPLVTLLTFLFYNKPVHIVYCAIYVYLGC
jgi:hypothetical protein